MTDTKSVIVLRKNGCSSKEIKVSTNLNIDKLDISKFPDKYIKGVNTNKLERECDFDYLDKIISIFAFNEGAAGEENKTELPPPLDKQLYFNNIFVIGHNNNKIVNLTKSEFDEFYETSFGGFDDINSDDSWSEEEEANSEDEDFVVNDDDEIEKVSSSEEEEEYISEEDTEDSSDELNLESDSSKDKESDDKIEKDINENNTNVIRKSTSKPNDSKIKNKKKMKKKSSNKKSSNKKKPVKETNEVQVNIDDEEENLINDYVISLSNDFSDSPKDFKDTVYKHHDKNPKYVLKWIVSKLQDSPDEYKDLYLKYRTLVN